MTEQLETGVQADVIACYETVRCNVAHTSGGRKGGTWNTPGMPDLYVFPPLSKQEMRAFEGGHVALLMAPWWHESKIASGGRQSVEQRAWELACLARGVAYIKGGVPEALAHLRRLGLVR